MKTIKAQDLETAAAWRDAVWILEALPPATRSAAPRPLRDRKLTRLVERLSETRGAAAASLAATVTDAVPFGEALMWWAREREVSTPRLGFDVAARRLVGRRLLDATGSAKLAHAMLLDHAKANAGDRDLAFSENAIRAQIVRELQER